MAEFERTRSALLVMDFQNYGFDPEGYWPKRFPEWLERAKRPVENTVRALTAARDAGMLVIHVGQSWRDGHIDANLDAPWEADAKSAGRTVSGSWGVEFFPPVAPTPGELVIHKHGVSALAGTELDRLLRVQDIKTLVLTGCATNFAVEGTAREAADWGYRVIVLEDCCEAMTDEEHEHSITKILPAYGIVRSTDEFIAWLKEPSPARTAAR